MDGPGDTTGGAVLSIGGLARATGIATETLRTWERRYGFPTPRRTASGHRRYTLETAARLRLVHQALQHGHRPSAVVTCPVPALEALLGLRTPPSAARDEEMLGTAPETALSAPEAHVAAWLDHVRAFEADALERALGEAWGALGAEAFVLALAGPFLRTLGEAWARGELGVAHEHFASERLRDFVAERWRGLARQGRGPHVVLAALTGEQHTLVLHLAAALLARQGLRPLILGADTPALEVARAARDTSARAVVIASSAAARPEHTEAELGALRRALPVDVELVVGGHAPRVPEGVQRLPRLDGLSAWGAALARA